VRINTARVRNRLLFTSLVWGSSSIHFKDFENTAMMLPIVFYTKFLRASFSIDLHLGFKPFLLFDVWFEKNHQL